MTQCFIVRPSERAYVTYSSYFDDPNGPCPSARGGATAHSASVVLELDTPYTPDLTERLSNHPRQWPEKCACGFVFAEEHRSGYGAGHYWQDGRGHEYRHPSEFGPGAMFDATWFHGMPWACGADGLALIVVCPDGRSWHIDGGANNCTDREGQRLGKHKCWTRTGTPPLITVGKQFGPTCGAGGGSIDTGSYHGFLQDGQFTPGL
jgi:hypothetical protein